MAWSFAVFDYHAYKKPAASAAASASVATVGVTRLSSPSSSADRFEALDDGCDWDHDTDDQCSALIDALVRRGRTLLTSSSPPPLSAASSSSPVAADGEHPWLARQWSLFELWARTTHPAIFRRAIVYDSPCEPPLHENPSLTVWFGLPPDVVGLVGAGLVQLRPGGDMRLCGLKPNVWVNFATVAFANLDQRLLIDVCHPRLVHCNDRGETRSGGLALRSRLFRQAGYRVLYISAATLCGPIRCSELRRAVDTSDTVTLDCILSGLAFVVSRRGILVPRSVPHWLLTSPS